MAYQPKHALSVSAQLKLDIKEFAANLSKASKQMMDFAKDSVKPLKDMDSKLHTIGLGLRDVARIASGILISQTFYKGAQAIGDATNALSEFNEKLDYAHVTYTALFGSSDISTKFLDTLKEQAIDTMYSFEDLTQASKKLLAYGIDYKNVGYITEGLGNLAAMSGDTAAMDRISYALGQIYAKGTLKAEEMRQLANAYVPIQQILRESFNLTDDQLGNVGNLRIPAEQAINAIVDYANTKFASVGDAAMLTITGLKSRIVDNFKVTGSEITKPLVTAFKSFLAWFDGQLTNVRKAFSSGGSGGIFEYLVPDEGTRQLIRQFLASLGNMLMSVMRLLASMAPIVGTAFSGFITAFNIISPGITLLVNLLAGLVKMVANSKVAMNILTGAIIAGAAAWTIYKARLLSAALLGLLTKGIYAVARAVMVLSATIVKSPIVGVLGIVAIGLIAVAGASEKARKALSGFFDKFQGLANGLKSDDILQVKDGMDKTTDSSKDFNNALEGSGETLDELNKKAAAAKKGLLSFDEVFKLNDTNDETSTPEYDGMLDGLDFSGDTLLPEIPDFSDYTNKFTDALFGDLWESIKRIASGAAGGALVGGLIGFAIGGLVTRTMAGAMEGAKWGSRIGTAVGGGFATFWGDAYKQMQDAVNKITVAGGIGVLVGGLAGMVIAAFATTGLTGKARVNAVMMGGKLGAALGGLLGAGIGGFWSLAEDGFSNSLQGLVAGGSAGALVGGLVGMVLAAFATTGLTGKARLKAVMTGAGWGATIGSLIGGGFGAFWGSASDEMKKEIEAIAVGAAGGALAGGLAGLVIGAFTTKTLSGALTGAKWGTAIGGLLGGTLKPFWDSATSEMKSSIESLLVGGATGALVGGLVGMVLGAFVTRTLSGAMAGAKWGASIGALIGGPLGTAMDDAEATLTDKISNMFSSIKAASYGMFIGGLVGMIVGAVVGAFAGGVGALPGARLGGTIGAAAGGLVGLLVQKLAELDVGKAIGDWFISIGEKIKNLAGDIKEWFIDEGNWKGITMLIVNPVAGAAKLLYDNNEDFQKWVDDLWAKTKDGFNKIKNTVTDWAVSTKEWFIDDGNWKGISLLIVNPVAGAAKLLYDNNEDFQVWVDDLWARTKTGFAKVAKVVSDWAVETYAKVKDWTVRTLDKLDTWIMDTGMRIADWCVDTAIDFGKWVASTATKFGNWVTDTASKVGDWAVRTGGKLSNWWSDTKAGFSDWYNNTSTKVSNWCSRTSSSISDWFTNTKSNVKSWWSNLWNVNNWRSGWSHIKQWFNDLFSSIGNWFNSIGSSISSWWDNLWSGKSVKVSSSSSSGSYSLKGHATGGVFNREHIARFAEGNKAEAIIPLQNDSAMQPFVDAVSNGLLSSLMPALATSGGGGNDLPPMYVGTLIADDKGLKELERKLKVIRVKEEKRGN